MRHKALLTATLVAGGLLGGCTSYYRVTDPHSQQVYYTQDLNRQSSGVVVFKDAKTSQEVTLAASEIQQIPKEAYDVGRYSSGSSPAPSSPAPSAPTPTTRPAGE